MFQSLHIQARSTYLYKHQNTDLCYLKGTSFLPHKNTVETEPVFINTVCTQKEKTLPVLIEKPKNHPITLNKGVIGYAVCDLVLSRDTRKFNMRDCIEFAYSLLNKYEELDNCKKNSTQYKRLSQTSPIVAQIILTTKKSQFSKVVWLLYTQFLRTAL